MTNVPDFIFFKEDKKMRCPLHCKFVHCRNKDVCGRVLDTSKPVRESLHTSQISRRKKNKKVLFPSASCQVTFLFLNTSQDLQGGEKISNLEVFSKLD